MKTIDPMMAREMVDKLTNALPDQRARIVGEYARLLSWSASKVRKVAREHGFRSGRNCRKDKGAAKNKVDEKVLLTGAAMMLKSKRLTDKFTMPGWKVLEILSDNGRIAAETSLSWFNQQLRLRKISKNYTAKETPAIGMASRHPNQVHQMDFSVCIQYDFKEKGTKWKMVDRDMQKAFYKNKPGYWKDVKKVLIRAIMTDHCSCAFWVKYYYISGENSSMIVDFMYSAWEKKPDPEKYPFCGVPDILMMDPGSANTGQVITNLLRNLRVKTSVHFPGHARVKGQVERMHGYFEEAFESELCLKKAMDIEELNARSYDYAMHINTNKKHRRHGNARFVMWNQVAPEQLRLLPAREIYNGLCNYNPVQATVDNRKCIQFDGRIYQIKGPFRPSDKVWVIKNPYKEPFIEISDKKEYGEFWPVELIYTDKYGFNVNAAVIGESYKRHADDETAKFVRAVENKEISLEGIGPKLQMEKAGKIAYIERQGTEIVPVETHGRASVPKAADFVRQRPQEQPEIVLYPRCDVYKEIRFRMKLERITPLQSQVIEKLLAEKPTPGPSREGMVEDAEIDEIIRKLRGDKPSPDPSPGSAALTTSSSAVLTTRAVNCAVSGVVAVPG